MTDRGRIVAEVAVLCALGLLAIFWVIPAQTADGGIGLDPRDVPTVCVAVFIALIAFDGALRLTRTSNVNWLTEAKPAARRSALPMIAICIGVSISIQFVSMPLVSAVAIPLLMLALTERRPLRIACTTTATVAVLAIALGWRG